MRGNRNQRYEKSMKRGFRGNSRGKKKTGSGRSKSTHKVLKLRREVSAFKQGERGGATSYGKKKKKQGGGGGKSAQLGKESKLLVLGSQGEPRRRLAKRSRFCRKGKEQRGKIW